MSMIYLSGEYMNAMNRGTVTVTPAALAAYPASNLYDRDPSTPLVLGSVLSNSHIDLELNALTNRGFESALSTGWTDTSVAAGSATRVDVGGFPAYVSAGSYGLSLVSAGAANYGEVRQAITAQSGEYRRLGVYAKTIAGTPDLKFVIYNSRTGRYWNGTTWTTSTTVTPTGTLGGTFTSLYATYQVEDFDTCGAEAVEIVVYIRNMSAAASTLAVDDASDVPGINFCGVFGHNIGKVATSVVQYDITNAYAGAEVVASTQTIKRGSYYSSFSIAYSPYWRLVIGGSNWDEPYIGELVLGQTTTCATSPKWGLSTERSVPGVRGRGLSGRPYAYSLAHDHVETLNLAFTPRTEAEAKEIENLYLRSGQGRWPTVIVPIDSESAIYYGRMHEPVTRTRPFQGVHEIGFEMTTDPLPVIGL